MWVCARTRVLSVTSFLNQLVIIRLILFSILVEIAAKDAKQDAEKQKTRKPEEGTARIVALCWLCAFLLSCITWWARLNTGTLELQVNYIYTGGRGGDEAT